MEDHQACDSRQDMAIGAYGGCTGYHHQRHGGSGISVSTDIERWSNRHDITRQVGDWLRRDATEKNIVASPRCMLGSYPDTGHGSGLQCVVPEWYTVHPQYHPAIRHARCTAEGADSDNRYTAVRGTAHD